MNRNTRFATATLLCTAALMALAVAIAACTPKDPKPGVPITGVLFQANGNVAPLTINDGVGTGFSMDATLDSADVIVTNQSWKCYTPAPPNYPNYDIEGSDRQTYGLFISISPVVWTTGAHPIDSVNVSLFLSTPDRYGAATNGTVTLLKTGTAPDTAGSECSFVVSANVPLFGERDP